MSASAGGLVAALVAAVALSGCSSGGAGTEVKGVFYEAGSPTTAASESGPTGSPSDGDAGGGGAASEGAPSGSSSTVAPTGSGPARPASGDAGVTTTSLASDASSSAVTGTFLVGGLGIGGVRVVLIDSSGGTRSTATDLLGRFRIANVSPGTYRLELHDPGDDTPLCDLSGTCVTTRPLHVESRTVEVIAGRDILVTISL